MADDIQNVTMTTSYVPYERPPQPFTLWTAIPRGLMSFLVPTAILDAKALGDRAILNLNATLPPNFGYVMADMMVSITQDKSANWADPVTLTLQNFYRAAEDDSVALSATYLSHSVNFSEDTRRTMTRTEFSTPFPSFPIIGQQSGVLSVINMVNSVSGAAAVGTINAYLSFWQFDLEQIRKYPINSPQPVHSR